jgi:hypothetical protein
MARGVATEELHSVARAVQVLGQKFDQGLVGRGIHGRGGYFDAEFAAQRVAYFIGGCAWLELDRQEHSVGLNAKKGWHGHGSRMKSGGARPGKLGYYFSMNIGSSSFLWASLIWGSVGMGFAIYGKRQKAMAPLVGGVALVAISYFISSALLMSLVGIGLVAGIVWHQRQGD